MVCPNVQGKYLKNQVQNIPDFSGIFVKMTEHPRHFLLVDDHPVLADAMTMVLKNRLQGVVIYTAFNGLEALGRLETQPIDMVLLDVNMPEMDGYETFRLIRKKYPALKVILLTQHGGKEMQLHFFKNGINGIVFKGEQLDIVQVIQSVWEKGRWFPPHVLQLMGEQFSIEPETNKLPLSNRDRQLIQLISAGKSSKEIASIMNLGENTVNSYRQMLLRQTGAKNTDELIALAFRNGLLK